MSPPPVDTVPGVTRKKTPVETIADDPSEPLAAAAGSTAAIVLGALLASVAIGLLLLAAL